MWEGIFVKFPQNVVYTQLALIPEHFCMQPAFLDQTAALAKTTVLCMGVPEINVQPYLVPLVASALPGSQEAMA